MLSFRYFFLCELDEFLFLQKFGNSELYLQLILYKIIVYFISSRSKSEEVSNLKRIEKKVKKSSIKPIIGFDRGDMK